jgi:valyl-tRNA synthetase
VLTAIRRAKSDAKQSMRAEVASVNVTDTTERLAALSAAEGDVTDAGKVAKLVTHQLGAGQDPSIEVVLADG